MPADTAVRADTKTLLKAARWSIQYLIDPKRGALKKLPTDGELAVQFPDSNLTTGDVENWLFNEFGSTNLEAIAKNQQRLTETIQKIERFENQTAAKEAVVPKIAPTRPTPLKTSRGKVSALGVLAELESIEPILRKHQQETAPKLEKSLQSKVEAILPKAVKGLDKNLTATIAQEIASETARETLENVARIQDLSQINQVLADSLTQSIIAHPQIAEVKTSEGKLYEQVFNQTQDIAQANQPDLEKAAVLGSISQISELKKPGQQTLEVIADQVEQTVETQAPLTPPEERSYLTGILGTYLATYADNFEEKLAPSLASGQIPSFEQLQKIKDAAHNQTVTQVAVNVKSTEGKIIDSKIGFKPLTEHIASVMGLKPLSADKAESLGLGNARPKALTFAKAAGTTGFGVGLILNSPDRQVEAYHSLLAYNKPRLEKTTNDLRQKVEWFKKQPRLSYRQKKDLLSYEGRLRSLSQAQQFPIKQPKRFKTYLSYFQSLPVGRRLDWASQSAWTTTEAFSGQYQGVTVPRSLATNPVILSGRTFGSLSFGLGNFNFALPKVPLVGMGKTVTSRLFVISTAAAIGGGIIKRVAKVGGAVLGGLGLYFYLALGKAALMGFLIGGAIGGTAGAVGGAIVGAQIGAAIGTALFPGVGTVVGAVVGGAVGATIGFFVGAGIGGVAGALTALGLTSGSTTLAGTGIGMAAGTTIGFAFGGPIGAILGAAAGAAIGYAIGQYVVPVIKGAFDAIGSAFTGTAGAGASALGAIGGFFTGAAATIWGGITGAGGAILSGLSAAGNFIVGGLAGLTVPASAAAIPVFGGIGAVAVGGTIVGIVTATSFFSSETDTSIIPGQNEFFTIAKTVDKNYIPNPPPNRDLTFTIILTAKDKNLTNVVITDELKVQGDTSSFSVPVPPDPCPDTIPAGDNCTYTFTITADPSYINSLVINTVTAKATPDGESEITDSATATAAVGTPPSNCPSGWPTAHGFISQDPQGATSHNRLYPTEQAIDIGGNNRGTPTLTTFTGRVVNVIDYDEGHYGLHVDIQGTCSGKTFTARWAHLNSIEASITEGTDVTLGQKIGGIDDTGNSEGDHLHYSFFGLDMKFPYIPDDSFPPTCDGETECGVSW